MQIEFFYSYETKSTSDYVFILDGGAVSWRSAKQTIISCSTMKVEITSVVEFLKNFLFDLPLLNKPIPPMSMHYDSQVAISKVTSKKINEKKKTF